MGCIASQGERAIESKIKIMPRKTKVTFADEPFWMAAADVKPDPENANTHSARSIEAIARSLLRFGFRKPIVADKNKVVRAGNGTLEAVNWIAAQITDSPEDEAIRNRAQELGILRPDAKGKLVPWLRCEISDLEGYEATAYALADNQTAKLSVLDMTKVAAQIRTTEISEADAISLGFDWKEIFPPSTLAAVNQLGNIVYKIVIVCTNEAHQIEVMDFLERNEIQCQPLNL